MIAAVDVDSMTLAGAFLLGAALATVATLRIMRNVVDYFDGVDHRRKRAPGSPRTGDPDGSA